MFWLQNSNTVNAIEKKFFEYLNKWNEFNKLYS